jgi:hypothetical protein
MTFSAASGGVFDTQIERSRTVCKIVCTIVALQGDRKLGTFGTVTDENSALQRRRLSKMLFSVGLSAGDVGGEELLRYRSLNSARTK